MTVRSFTAWGILFLAGVASCVAGALSHSHAATDLGIAAGVIALAEIVVSP